MKNKKIGIIGGVGPQASNYLYKKIINLSQGKYGAINNDDFPEIILYSIPVPDFISNKNNISEAKKMFKRAIAGFEKMNVDYIAIASNTVHILLDDFQKMTKISFISMVKAVVDKTIQNKETKVGLLSSSTTIKSKIYENLLLEAGINLIYPNETEMKIVDNMIREVLSGSRNNNKNKYINIIDNLFKQGANTVILGCTELPLAINYEAICNRIYNSVDILAERIVDIYYNKEN